MRAQTFSSQGDAVPIEACVRAHGRAPGSNRTPNRVRSECDRSLEALPPALGSEETGTGGWTFGPATVTHSVLRESKVTVKIPRPLYRKIQLVVHGSGFSSPTDFIVYVLRDLMGEAGDHEKPEFSKDELEELKRKLKKLGYL